jgi:hypothetical protein
MVVVRMGGDVRSFTLEAGQSISTIINDVNLQAMFGYDPTNVDVSLNYESASLNTTTKNGDLITISHKAAKKA